MENVEINTENIIKYFDQIKGFISYNDIHIESLTNDKAVLYANINENSLNPGGTVHGGLIFGLADTTMGTLAMTTGKNVMTIDSNINYIKPCTGNIIKCVAEKVRVGNTIGVYKADIFNSKDELAATITANYIFIKK